MSLSLHTIKPATGATRKKKRIGRGLGSGHGAYSTRGVKGQRARAGVSNLKRLGLRPILLHIPKKRGFKSDKPKNQIVKLIDINKNFVDGDLVNPKILLKKGLIDNLKVDVKILSDGRTALKKVKLEGVKMSASIANQLK